MREMNSLVFEMTEFNPQINEFDSEKKSWALPAESKLSHP